MKLVYQKDAYVRELDTRIEKADKSGNRVIFSETIIYPGGGGQPYDIGSFRLNDKLYRITGAAKENNELWYLTDGDAPSEGEKVSLSIDWERRYALMRTHTCMHILCGVIWRDYGKPVTGGNMEPLKGRMDFDFENLDRDMLTGIEKKINAEVDAAREITIRFADPNDFSEELIRTKTNLIPEGVSEIRLVKITGLDIQADGGTHVNNTREVGPIKITGMENKGRNNKRIKVELT